MSFQLRLMVDSLGNTQELLGYPQKAQYRSNQCPDQAQHL